METGVSYFSSRDLRHVRADLHEMAATGCTYVVHCFTETDVLYYRDTMREIVIETHNVGMKAWMDPWGLAGIFSGETLTKFPLDHPETWQVLSDRRKVPAACPNHPETRKFMREWVESCAYVGADVLFWDEPHFYVGFWRGDFSGAWACYCEECLRRFQDLNGAEMPREFTAEVKAFREASLLSLLSELCDAGHDKGMRNALCLIPTDLAAHGFPEPEERMRSAMAKRLGDAPRGAVEAVYHVGVGDFDAASAIPALDIFGCDPYWYLFGTDAEAFMREYSRAAAHSATEHGCGLQLWVQAFRVPDGREEELRIGLRVAEEVEASHVAAWSYRATESMSEIACARPDIVWQVVADEFRRLRRSG